VIELFRKIFNWIVMSDIYASLIAAGIVLMTAAVLKLPLDLFSTAAVFVTAFAVYALNRQDDGDIDSINIPERTRFVARQGWIALVLSTAGFFFLLAYAFMSHMPIFILMISVYVLGLFYSFPLLRPIKNLLGFSRLKEPFAVKNLLVSGMYGLFVLFPIFNAGASITITGILLFVFVFLRFFIISTVFDMRDVEGDALKQINTIPVILGKDNALKLLHGLNILSLLLIPIGIFEHAISPLFAAMVLTTFPFAFYYLEQCRSHTTDMKYLCSVVVEADYIPATLMALPFLFQGLF
jgi:4-hydroxybenzoate polyprenyltransferase